MIYNSDEMRTLAREARLVRAALLVDLDAITVIDGEVWRRRGRMAARYTLRATKPRRCAPAYSSAEAAIREAMRLIAWRLDRAADL